MALRRVLVSGLAVAVTTVVCVGLLVATVSYADGAATVNIDPETREVLDELFAGTGVTDFVVVSDSDSDGDDEASSAVVAYHGYAGEDWIGTAARGIGEGYRGPIEVLLATDTTGAVIAVSVIAQRETAGLGDVVAEPGFLQRFAGRTADDAIRIGEDIDNISGATASAEGVAEAVREGLARAAAERTTGREDL